MKIDHIIIHCSDSEFGSAALIRQWHMQGNGWADVGYHFVIANGQLAPGLHLPAMDGAVEQGRLIDADGELKKGEIGAHALGMNDRAIGICLIGVKHFTPRQLGSLFALVGELAHRYKIPPSQVLGHCELPQAGGKTCPNLDMAALRSLLGGV